MRDPERMIRGNIFGTARRFGWALFLPVFLSSYFSLSVSVSAADRYVATNGVNSGSATNPASPWQTIRHAVSNALASDYIHLAAGTYTESNITVSVPGLVIEGAGKTQTLVQAAVSRGMATSRVFLLNTNCTLRGMTVRYGRFTSANHGAAIDLALQSAYDVTIENCRIVENDPAGSGVAPNFGGSVSAGGATASGTLRLLNCDIASNTLAGTATAAGGAGVVVDSKSLFISNCVLAANTSAGRGGAVFALGTAAAQLTAIFDSALIGNTASEGGGVYAAGQLVMQGCLVAGNSATETQVVTSSTIGGGGIYFNGPATGLVCNSTIYSNSTAWLGGGLYLRSLANCHNCTIYGNYAAGTNNGGGGGLYIYAQSARLSSTIVAGNASAGLGKDIGNTSPQLCTNSLVGNNAGTSLPAGAPTNGNWIGSPALPLDPGLLPLADNGGLTWTCALTTNSPAIDHGLNALNLNYDQRGAPYPRVYPVVTNRPDIGAYEYSLLRSIAPKGSCLTVW